MADMTSFMEQLSPSWDPDSAEFKPVARYYSAMDHILYLKEDCSYRADRVDEWLTLLWHPYKWELVGIKLKSVSVFRNFLNDSDDVFPIAEILVVISRRAKLNQKYSLAIQFAANENAAISSDELRRAV
jgi:hypothetical protein